MVKFKNNLYYYLLSSFMILLGAYFIEYVLGYKPCTLCVYQRYPYFAVIIFIFFALKFNFNQKIIYKILIVLFLVSMILASYHTGVEKNIFAGLEGCSSKSSEQIGSLSDMKDIIFDTIPSCNHAEFKIFSISLAEWNIIISVIFVYFCFRDLKKSYAK